MASVVASTLVASTVAASTVAAYRDRDRWVVTTADGVVPVAVPRRRPPAGAVAGTTRHTG